MKKSVRSTVGIIMLVLGVLLLGADRLVASADSGVGYLQNTGVLTVVALVMFLIGAIWLFRTLFD
jgi:hypothetical protein